MAGAELRSDGHERTRHGLDRDTTQVLLKARAQALSGDEARAAKIEIEKAEDAPPRQVGCELLQPVQLAGDITGACHGADRGARNNVGLQSCGNQRTQYAYVGPAARGAAAERQADGWSIHFLTPHTGHMVL